jgi:AraC-like DNA-binding protein/quercetin dioxygenase-like cupin family protein
MQDRREEISMVSLTPNSPRWTLENDRRSQLPSLPELHMVGYDHYRKASPLSEHKHPGCYEFVFVEKGKATWDIQGKTYETKAGDVFHTVPDESHSGSLNLIEPCKIWWFILEAPGTRRWLALSSTEKEEVAKRLALLPRVTHTGLMLAEPFQRLRSAFDHQDALASVEIRLALLEILMVLLRPEKSRSVPDDLIEQLNRLIAKMNSHPEWRPSVEELAALAKVSPSHFYRMFQQFTGLTPMSYMDRARMNEACRRLLDNSLSITKLSNDLGYSSSQHFATVFKRFMGTTPTLWREENLRTMEPKCN